MVDKLVEHPGDQRWPYAFVSRLFADTVPELHAFAGRMGLQRAWFKAERELPYYNLTHSQRVQALQLGALQVGDDEVKALIRRRMRAQGV